jgi:hypothetical protein
MIFVDFSSSCTTKSKFNERIRSNFKLLMEIKFGKKEWDNEDLFLFLSRERFNNFDY